MRVRVRVQGNGLFIRETQTKPTCWIVKDLEIRYSM